MELKLIADIGLIGLPNAGKSSLLRRLSSARPRVAPFPFTTKRPYLGIVDLDGLQQLVLADLPGLIEGAHRGVGLGHEFLRHIERTYALLHLLDIRPPDGRSPIQNFRTIEKELALYSPVLAQKPRLIVANKMDLPGAQETLEELARELGQEVVGVSALTGTGLSGLVHQLFTFLGQVKGPRKGWD